MSITQLLQEAQAMLETMPCGGIGPNGATEAELIATSEAGQNCEDDASYHQAQWAWRKIEQALKELEVKP